jgi:hypothetical protein
MISRVRCYGIECYGVENIDLMKKQVKTIA